MSKTDHLAKAKDYIAIAEAGDSRAEAYARAAEEIAAWLAAGKGRTLQQAADAIGKHKSFVSRLLSARNNGTAPDWGSGSNKRDEVARKVLSDPEQTREVIASLSAKQLDAIASAATETLIERHRAERAEHDTKATARELMGGDKFNPSEFWADTLVIRISRNARELASLIQRAGGLLYGSMTPDTAFEYLHEAEGLVAEARAAAQEQVRDGVRV